MSLIKHLTCSRCGNYNQYAILHYGLGENFVCNFCLKEKKEKSMNPPTINPDLPLKSCPFCGGKGKARVFPLYSNIGVSVDCTTNHCAGSTTTFYTTTPRGEFGTSLENLLEIYEKAVDQWNTRA